MKKIEIFQKLPIRGSIIDIEATHYDSSKGELITVGFLHENGFSFLQRLHSTERQFKDWVAEEMLIFKEPWFAFNKKCEEGFCKKSVAIDLQLGQESAYAALLKENLLTLYDLLSDPLFNEEVPIFWKSWVETGNLIFLSKIIRHNYCCLAKEYYLKLMRIDKIDLDKISPLLASPAIEKRHIRPSLNLTI